MVKEKGVITNFSWKDTYEKINDKNRSRILKVGDALTGATLGTVHLGYEAKKATDKLLNQREQHRTEISNKRKIIETEVTVELETILEKLRPAFEKFVKEENLKNKDRLSGYLTKASSFAAGLTKAMNNSGRRGHYNHSRYNTHSRYKENQGSVRIEKDMKFRTNEPKERREPEMQAADSDAAVTILHTELSTSEGKDGVPETKEILVEQIDVEDLGKPFERLNFDKPA
jgi:hypothetical protein